MGLARGAKATLCEEHAEFNLKYMNRLNLSDWVIGRLKCIDYKPITYAMYEV